MTTYNILIFHYTFIKNFSLLKLLFLLQKVTIIKVFEILSRIIF
nr:MAG TPA: hypothetical protein [Caudoviricetes sp.]